MDFKNKRESALESGDSPKVVIEAIKVYPGEFCVFFDKGDSRWFGYSTAEKYTEQEWRDRITEASGYDIDWSLSAGPMTTLHNRLQFTEVCDDNLI